MVPSLCVRGELNTNNTKLTGEAKRTRSCSLVEYNTHTLVVGLSAVEVEEGLRRCYALLAASAAAAAAMLRLLLLRTLLLTQHVRYARVTNAF